MILISLRFQESTIDSLILVEWASSYRCIYSPAKIFDGTFPENSQRQVVKYFHKILHHRCLVFFPTKKLENKKNFTNQQPF